MIQKPVLLQSLTAEKQDYRPCQKCERHPHFPSIPAVTQHVKDACVVCQEKNARALKSDTAHRKAVDLVEILKDLDEIDA
jgi:methylphosphotriester-DNA--protein-cysteine methyltransferase